LDRDWRGVMMAACFAVMWLTTMYQMWFSKPPEVILRRMGGEFRCLADIDHMWNVET